MLYKHYNLEQLAGQLKVRNSIIQIKPGSVCLQHFTADLCHVHHARFWEEMISEFGQGGTGLEEAPWCY